MKFESPAAIAILELQGTLVKTAVIPIGSWDMVTVTFKLPGHTLDITKILSFQALIFRDDLAELVDITYADFVTGIPSGYIVAYVNHFELGRQAGGEFDNVNHSNAVINRGYIIVQYSP